MAKFIVKTTPVQQGLRVLDYSRVEQYQKDKAASDAGELEGDLRTKKFARMERAAETLVRRKDHEQAIVAKFDNDGIWLSDDALLVHYVLDVVNDKEVKAELMQGSDPLPSKEELLKKASKEAKGADSPPVTNAGADKVPTPTSGKTETGKK
jgi:hypothetical protein